MEKEIEKEKKVIDYESVLEFVDTVSIPATSEKFFVRHNFIVRDTRGLSRVTFIEPFETWFLNEREEPLKTTQTLCYHKIRKSCYDTHIIAELHEKAETSLTAIHALIEQQKCGENGVLLIKGCNIFYIRESFKNVLRTVTVRWDGSSKWCVCATSLKNEDSFFANWNVGYRVFSHN